MNLKGSDLELRPFDTAGYLGTPEARSEYLCTAFETDDPACIRKALATLPRGRGMTATAKERM